mmetsp:Transcript_25494/g.74339  ORF Transcript_25494/g.74339 Transcript_25494/m.74339 type:complete len:143 (-) Transcript_25494:93-521(-)
MAGHPEAAEAATLPRAPVVRLAKEELGPETKLEPEAELLLQRAAEGFLNRLIEASCVSSQSRHLGKDQSRTALDGCDVLEALKGLGCSDMQSVAARAISSAPPRGLGKSERKRKLSDREQQTLAAEQDALFAEAAKVFHGGI